MKRFSFRDANGVQHVVGVYGAERIADLERAAETSRAEHAALRPEVARFARDMERKLRANDHKGGWGGDVWPALLVRLEQETLELQMAIRDGRRADVRGEAADVANFAMMLAENEGIAQIEETGAPSEHAAALGLATARIRELEGAVAELAKLFPSVPAPADDDTCDDDDTTCGKCGSLCTVDDGAEFERGDPCHPCAQDAYVEARAIVARIEKATKVTT